MTDDDFGFYSGRVGREIPRSERVAFHLERAKVMKPAAALTEAEIERRNVEAKLRLEQHDEYFGAEFVSLGGPMPISRKLARRLGFDVDPADNGYGDMGDSGNPDPAQAPPRDFNDDD